MSRNFWKTAIFTFWQKQCFYLTHSPAEYLEKLPIKNKQESQLQTVISQKLCWFQSQNWNYLKVHSSFFKKVLFFAHSTHVGTWKGALPLQPLVSLVVARSIQGVKDEVGKDLNLLFCLYFLWKWAETFEKLQFLHLGKRNAFT